MPPAPHCRWVGKSVGTGRRQPAEDEGDTAASKPRSTLCQDKSLRIQCTNTYNLNPQPKPESLLKLKAPYTLSPKPETLNPKT